MLNGQKHLKEMAAIEHVDRVEDIVKQISFGKWSFRTAFYAGTDRVYVQVRCSDGKCNVTGEDMDWGGRKWPISQHATRSEIVQTVFKAVLTAQEHETREQFLYKGRAIFGPHLDVDRLWELTGTKDHQDVRKDPGVEKLKELMKKPAPWEGAIEVGDEVMITDQEPFLARYRNKKFKVRLINKISERIYLDGIRGYLLKNQLKLVSKAPTTEQKIAGPDMSQVRPKGEKLSFKVLSIDEFASMFGDIFGSEPEKKSDPTPEPTVETHDGFSEGQLIRIPAGLVGKIVGFSFEPDGSCVGARVQFDQGRWAPPLVADIAFEFMEAE